MTKKTTEPINPPSETQDAQKDPQVDPMGVVLQESKPVLKAEPIQADEGLPAFQKVIHVTFSEAEFAERGKASAKLDKEIEEKENEKREFDSKINSEIKDLEAQRRAISDAVNVGGSDREVTCRKRINWETGEATLFIDDPESDRHLEILESRKLATDELQTELRLANKLPPGENGKVIGQWPADQKVGDAEIDTVPEPDWDKMNAEKNQIDQSFQEDTAETIARQPGRGKKSKGKGK